MSKFFLEQRFHFDAAHHLVGYDGKCANVHGHRWRVDVRISGTMLNGIGVLIDLKDLRQLVEPILPDHKNLNDLPSFGVANPTAENLASYFYSILEPVFPEGVQLESVRVWETPEACACVERGCTCGC